MSDKLQPVADLQKHNTDSTRITRIRGLLPIRSLSVNLRPTCFLSAITCVNLQPPMAFP